MALTIFRCSQYIVLTSRRLNSCHATMFILSNGVRFIRCIIFTPKGVLKKPVLLQHEFPSTSVHKHGAPQHCQGKTDTNQDITKQFVNNSNCFDQFTKNTCKIYLQKKAKKFCQSRALRKISLCYVFMHNTRLSLLHKKS